MSNAMPSGRPPTWANLVSDVIGGEKTDDVALPRAGVDVVVPVENDVFRSVDLAQTNDFRVASRSFIA